MACNFQSSCMCLSSTGIKGIKAQHRDFIHCYYCLFLKTVLLCISGWPGTLDFLAYLCF